VQELVERRRVDAQDRLVPVDQGRDQCGLVREVLVHRSDADAGDLGHAVGIEPSQRLAPKNASRRSEDGLHRVGRAGLAGRFSLA
jgi:hypothetical protein